jgi:hypothetical protein
VRPLLGAPGAASIGPALLTRLDSASVAPGGRGALITREGRSWFVRGLPELAPSDPIQAGFIENVDRVVWSRDGSFALLYSSAGGQLQRVRVADSDILLDSPVSLSWLGEVSTLAVDAAGRQIAIGVVGSNAGLYLFNHHGTPALLSAMTHPAAVAFDGSGRRLYAIDLDAQRILEFDSGEASEFASLPRPDEPAPAPVGMAVSGCGRYLFFTDRAARVVRVYETASRTLVNSIPLDFAPLRFEALSAAPSFLLNGDSSKEWLLILDARETPRVYFVPANREEQQ